jgi:hypothetical protein
MNQHARARQGIPLRADPQILIARATRSVARAAVAVARRTIDPRTRMAWDDDDAAAIVTRAARPPLATTDATAFTPVVQLFVRNLVPYSAAAGVLDLAIGVDFAGAAAVTLPLVSGIICSWVGEGAPIPSRSGTTSGGPKLTPCKLATLVSLSNEMIRHTAAVELITLALNESCGPALDAMLFSNNAAVGGLSPAGILNGATSVTASTASNSINAMYEDLSALAGAVAPYSGNSQIAFIMGAREATFVGLAAERMPENLFVSSQVAAKTVIAVAAQALVSTIGTLPTIEASGDVMVHEADPALPAVDIGGVVASPLRSVYQTDTTSLRLLLPISWTMRAAGACAVVTNVAW